MSMKSEGSKGPKVSCLVAPCARVTSLVFFIVENRCYSCLDFYRPEFSSQDSLILNSN